MQGIALIDYHIVSFYKQLIKIMNKRADDVHGDEFTLLYIQNQLLVKRDLFLKIPSISNKNLLLIDLKESIYTRDYDRISDLLGLIENKSSWNQMYEVFIFGSKMLLLAYKGEVDLVERSIEEYVFKYGKQYSERMRLYIYSFILFFYPNLPIKIGDLSEKEEKADVHYSNRIIKLSILAHINKSIQRYDRSFLCLSRALNECLSENDLINYFQIYDQYFFYECMRGDLTRIFGPLDDLHDRIEHSEAIGSACEYYRFMFDYINGFRFDIKKALKLLDSLSKNSLYTYIHKLSMLLVANGRDPSELHDNYPYTGIFHDICFAEGYLSGDSLKIPFYVPDDFKPVLCFHKMASGFFRAYDMPVALECYMDSGADSVPHYGIYQAYRDVCEIMDANIKFSHGRLLASLKNLLNRSDHSNILKGLVIDIQYYLLNSSISLNKKFRDFTDSRSKFEKSALVSYLGETFAPEQIMAISGGNNDEKEESIKYEALPDDHDDILEYEELRALIGNSDEIQEIKRKMVKFSKFSFPVLITGESGTGKELVARAIHSLSHRKGRYISINCSAIPENLFESELFGYKKGAFSGASFDKKGLIESADHGTLFLDEIGDLPYGLQAKMLRFLQEGEVLALGDKENKKLDVRIIAATNVNIEEEIEKRNFRNDLFQRLNVLSLYIKPLRERKGDIKPLFYHFIDKYRNEFGSRSLKNADEILAVFQNYDWPGNIRELENEIIRIFAQLGTESYVKKEYISKKLTCGVKRDRSPFPSSSSANFKKPEENEIIEAWKIYNKNISKTARELGISRQWVHKVIKRSPNA